MHTTHRLLAAGWLASCRTPIPAAAACPLALHTPVLAARPPLPPRPACEALAAPPPPQGRTLRVQAGLASLVLGDLVHLVLPALLATAERLLGLGHVHLRVVQAHGGVRRRFMQGCRTSPRLMGTAEGPPGLADAPCHAPIMDGRQMTQGAPGTAQQPSKLRCSASCRPCAGCWAPRGLSPGPGRTILMCPLVTGLGGEKGGTRPSPGQQWGGCSGREASSTPVSCEAWKREFSVLGLLSHLLQGSQASKHCQLRRSSTCSFLTVGGTVALAALQPGGDFLHPKYRQLPPAPRAFGLRAGSGHPTWLSQTSSSR